jgi:hypothetical protein
MVSIPHFSTDLARIGQGSRLSATATVAAGTVPERSSFGRVKEDSRND